MKHYPTYPLSYKRLNNKERYDTLYVYEFEKNMFEEIDAFGEYDYERCKQKAEDKLIIFKELKKRCLTITGSDIVGETL